MDASCADLPFDVVLFEALVIASARSASSLYTVIQMSQTHSLARAWMVRNLGVWGRRALALRVGALAPRFWAWTLWVWGLVPRVWAWRLWVWALAPRVWALAFAEHARNGINFCFPSKKGYLGDTRLGILLHEREDD